MLENQSQKPASPVTPSQPFEKRIIETPILDSSVREKIAGSNDQPKPGGGFKEFYRANKFYFLAIFVGVITITVLAYFAFKKPVVQAPKDANVGISVDVPQTIANGGEAVYKIAVQNNDAQKLVSLESEATYPDGVNFISSSPQPENLSGSLFKVPDLISGQNAVIFLKTKVTGNVNDEKKLNLKLHYKYSNFNSEFIKDQSVTVTLVSSDVLVELQGPATANNGQIVIYTAKYQNNSDNDVTNSRIKMNYPAGFVFASANPSPDIGSDTWNIGTLAKAGTGIITIQGAFNSVSPGEAKTASADFIILDQSGQPKTQNTSTFTTAISSSPLLVIQDLVPSNSRGIIKPGDRLTFTVRYQNNASTAATGVNIAMSLDTKVVDLSSIRAEGGQINNNAILWNASTIPQLENLAPNESGQLTFSLQINNPAVKDSSKNLSVISNIKIKSNESDSYYSGNTLSLKVSSPSGINTFLSFVSGQLPPQVGKTSIYKIKFALTNSSNDYSNGILTAFIPLGSNAVIPGSFTTAEANNVQLDQSTGKLTWNVGSLPANTGKFAQAKILEFQVKLSPSASQAHQSPTIVNNINFIAKDNYTNEDINISADNITTNDVSGGSGNYGNGSVLP